MFAGSRTFQVLKLAKNDKSQFDHWKELRRLSTGPELIGAFFPPVFHQMGGSFRIMKWVRFILRVKFHGQMFKVSTGGSWAKFMFDPY